MRITGGTFGGRKLTPPKGKDIRPTSDRLRLAIFNMLESRLDMDGACAADMFCGTGALGIEAISRGAQHCYFWDLDRRSLDLAKSNLQALAVDPSRFQAKLGSATKIGERSGGMPVMDVVFIDPPYRKDLIMPCINALLEGAWLNDQAWLVVESEKGGLPDLSAIEQITEDRVKSYGDTDLALYHYER